MLDLIGRYLGERTAVEVARDFFDIFIVYYIFYRLLLVARGTRAIQIAAGLGIMSLLYVVAQTFELITIVTLFGSVLQSIILVIVVVFQNDIRRALQRVGSRAIFGGARSQESQVIEHVVDAARDLARHRIGAIITFEQDANLDEFIGQNKGVELDAKVSPELLVSLFIPEGSNKLHDGAVIIRNLRIAKAGVFFPMPETRTFDSSYGSRHRAAIGITEETDAVVVVVSEERGTISFCYNGNIAADLGAVQLREMLHSIMSPKGRVQTSRPSDSGDPSERVTMRSLEEVREEAPPPSVKPPSVLPREAESGPPKPLRKSSHSEHPPAELPSSDSLTLPKADPRPMPKGPKVERSHELDEPIESERGTTG